MKKIKNISRAFRLLFQFFFYAIPVLTAVAQIMWMKLPLNVLLLEVLLMAITLFGLYQLIQLFKHYEAGEIFSLANVMRYRNLAYATFAYVGAHIICRPIINFVVSLYSQSGEILLDIGFDDGDVSLLITGGIVLIIAYVMAEGHHLAQEQAKTI